MQPKTKKIIAYILNFIIVGAGFAFYNKILIGLGWLIIFVLANLSDLLWGMNVSILLRAIIMIGSYIHLYKIIEKSK